MRTQSSSNIVICILAHNEEKHLAQTVSAINVNLHKNISIYIYANGCTDNTIEIGKKLELQFPNVYLREIKIASKTNAWNEAFEENKNADIIIFSDGDIHPPKEAINILLEDLKNNPSVIISTSRIYPMMKNINWEKMFVGFMQLPLKHDFLSGGLYAVRNKGLREIFIEKNLTGLPIGIIGEDAFLEFILKTNQLYISTCKNYYYPPDIKDYYRYLARIRWQNEQLRLILGPQESDSVSLFHKIFLKFKNVHELSYYLISIPAVITKRFFIKLNASKIFKIYKSLGDVNKDGQKILNSLTRSNSTK